MPTFFRRALAAVEETRRKRVERKQAEGGGVQQVSGVVLGYCIGDKVEAKRRKSNFSGLADCRAHLMIWHPSRTLRARI